MPGAEKSGSIEFGQHYMYVDVYLMLKSTFVFRCSFDNTQRKGFVSYLAHMLA